MLEPDWRPPVFGDRLFRIDGPGFICWICCVVP